MHWDGRQMHIPIPHLDLDKLVWWDTYCLQTWNKEKAYEICRTASNNQTEISQWQLANNELIQTYLNKAQHVTANEIWGPHGSRYEIYGFLGCNPLSLVAGHQKFGGTCHVLS